MDLRKTDPIMSDDDGGPVKMDPTTMDPVKTHSTKTEPKTDDNLDGGWYPSPPLIPDG